MLFGMTHLGIFSKYADFFRQNLALLEMEGRAVASAGR